MKQVFLEYAGAVIALLGALSFLVVFHHFFVGKDGALAQMLVYSIGERSIADHEAFDAYKEDIAPNIVEKECYVIVANQSVCLTECFEAKSSKGETLPVYIRCAWDLDGDETDIGVSEDRRSICAPTAGVYWIQIYVIDKNGKETSEITKILVNER